MVPTAPDRAAVKLPRRLFSNVANTCLAELEGRAAGDFVGTIGWSAQASAVTLDEPTAARVTGLAFERLHTIGADPADFHATATVTARAGSGRTWVAVHAEAIARVRPGADEPAVAASCASSLCRIPRAGWREASASVVVVYELVAGGALHERLVVSSGPGGCSEAEHDAVGFAGFVLLDRPLVVVSRSTCDAWEFELHGIAADGSRLIARGAGGSPV